jgi:hypothetical protein
MGFLDFLSGSTSKSGGDRYTYDDGYLDGLEGLSYDYEKMKNRAYREGYDDGLEERRRC